MESITWTRPNAKGERNEKLYARYLEIYKKEKDRQGAAFLAGKEFGLSTSRAYSIVRAIEKKLAKKGGVK